MLQGVLGEVCQSCMKNESHNAGFYFIQYKVDCSQNKSTDWLCGVWRLIFLFFFSFQIPFSYSNVVFDNDAGNLLWSEPTNWSTNQVPGVNDSVSISGYQVELSSVEVVRQLTLIPTANNNTSLKIINGHLHITESIQASKKAEFREVLLWVSNDGILTTGGDVVMDRTALNNNYSNFQLRIDKDAQVSIGGDLVFNHKGNHTESQFDILQQDESNLSIAGDLILMMSGNSRTLNYRIENNAEAIILGDLIIDQSKGERIYVEMNDAAKIHLYGDLEIDVVKNTKDVRFEINGAGNNLLIGDSVIVNQSGGKDVFFGVNAAAAISIGSSVLLNKTGGEDFELAMAGSASFIVQGNLDARILSDGGNDNFILDLDESTFHVDSVLITQTIGGGGNVNTRFQIDQSTFVMNYFYANIDDGGSGDLEFFINNNSQLTPSTVICKGDFVVDHDGGDDFYFRLYQDANMQVDGDFDIQWESSDGDGIVFNCKGNGSLKIKEDFQYTATGVQNGETFDMNLDGGFLLECDDMLLDLDAGQDFLVDIGRYGLGNGTSLVVRDSLKIDHEGTSDDVFLGTYSSGSNQNIMIGTLWVEMNATGGDGFELEMSGVNDSLIIENDFYVKLQNGAIGTEDDIYIDINQGVFEVGGDLILEIDGGDFLSININDAFVTIGGDLRWLLTEGNDGEYVFDGAIVTIEDSMVVFQKANNENVDSEIDDGAILTIKKSFVVHIEAGRNYLRLGEDGIGKGTLTIGEDFIYENRSSENLLLCEYDASKIVIGNDFVVNNYLDGSGDYFLFFMDADEDSLIVGNNLFWTISGGVKDGDDDLRWDMDGGYVQIDGNTTLQSTGGDDVSFLLDAGNVHILGDLTLTGTSDVTFRVDNDSLIVAGKTTVTANGGENCYVDINRGKHVFGSFAMIANEISGLLNFDVDGGQITCESDLLFQAKGAATANFTLDNASRLTVQDSLIFDLDSVTNQSRLYMNEYFGSGAKLIVNDLFIDHEHGANEFRLATNKDSKLEILNDFTVLWDADDLDSNDGDWLELRMDGTNDSLIIGRNLAIDFENGTKASVDYLSIRMLSSNFLSVGNNVAIEMNNSGAFALSNVSGKFEVGNDFSIHQKKSQGYLFDLDGGSFEIANNLISNISDPSKKYSAKWDQDGGISTINGDFQFTGDSLLRFALFLDNKSKMSIGDTMILNIGEAADLNTIAIGTQISGASYLDVGTACIVNGDLNSNKFKLYLNNDARFKVEDNLVIDWNSKQSCKIQLGAFNNDTLEIGNDLLVRRSSGNQSGNAHHYFDQQGGYTNIGGDFLLSNLYGDQLYFEQKKGAFRANGDFALYSSFSDELRVDIDGGTTTVLGKVKLDLLYSDSRFLWDQDGGDVVVGEDFFLRLNGAGDSDFRLDFGSSIEVGDTLFFDLDSSSSTFEFYLEEEAGTGSGVQVGSSFTIDQEKYFQDFIIKLEGDALLDVTQDIILEMDAEGGDFFEFELNEPTDSLLVGGDLFFKMNSGSNHEDDDVILDFNDGFIQIGGAFSLENTGGADARFEKEKGCFSVEKDFTMSVQNGHTTQFDQVAGNTWVGGDFYFKNSQSRALIFNLHADSLVIAKDLIMVHKDAAATYDFTLNQDNGVLEVGDDFLLTVDKNDYNLISLDKGEFIIKDSLYIDLKESKDLFRLDIGNTIGAKLNIGSSFEIAHAPAAGAIEIDLNNTSFLEVANNVKIENNAMGADYTSIQLHSTFDTLKVGNDMLLSMPNGSSHSSQDIEIEVAAGYLEVSNDLFLNLTGGSSILLKQGQLSSAAETFVGGKVFFESINAQDISFDIDGGTITFQKDLKIVQSNASSRFFWDQDNARFFISEDLNIQLNGITEADLRLDNASMLTVGDTLSLDLDRATSNFEFYLEEDDFTGSALWVGSSFVIDQERNFGDFILKLEGDAKVDIAEDFVGVIDAADGDFMVIQIVGMEDSLIVGQDLKMTMASGTYNGDDDILFDQDHGVVSIGRDMFLSNTGGGDSRIERANGELTIGNDLILETSSAQVLLYRQLAGKAVIGGKMAMTSTASWNESFDIDADSLIIGKGLTLTHINAVSGYDLSWDQDGGTVLVGEDVFVKVDNNDFSNFRIDNGSWIIQDSLFFDLDKSTSGYEFFVGESSVSEANVWIGSNFYIDHEAPAGDMHVRLNRNGKMEVQNDFVIMNDADDDYFEFSMATALDTMIVGRDMLLKMPTGNAKVGDETFLDIDNGYLTIGRDLLMEVRKGSSLGFEQNLGEIYVGRFLTLNSFQGQDLYLQNYGGVLSVLDDVKFIHNQPRDASHFTMDVHNGILDFREDYYFRANGNAQSQFFLDGKYSWMIGDSMVFDLDASTQATLFYMNEHGSYPSGGKVVVGSHFYVDHEAAADDFRIRLDHDALLQVGSDFYIDFEAAGGDGVFIELTSSTDSLVVANDMILEIPSGSKHIQDILDIDVSGGLLAVGNDLLMYNNGGGYVRFDHENGINAETIIGRNFLIDVQNAFGIGLNIDGGLINVSNDFSLSQIKCIGSFDLDQDGGRIQVGDDFMIRQDGLGRNYWKMDNASALLVADSLYLTLVSSNDMLEFSLEDDNGKGSYIMVGNDFVIDHDSTFGNMVLMLEGDAKLEIQDDFVINHSATKDYIEVKIPENFATDSILVHGSVFFNLLSGNNHDDDDIRLSLNGGYLEVNEDLNLVSTNKSDDLVITQSGSSKMHIKGNVSFLGTDSDDLIWQNTGNSILEIDQNVSFLATRNDEINLLFGGKTSTIHGNVFLQNQQSPHNGHITYTHQAGINKLNGEFLMELKSPDTQLADASLVLEGGYNTFENKVVVRIEDGADNAQLFMKGGQTILRDSLVIYVQNNSDEVFFDIDAGSLSVQDLYIYHSNSSEFNMDQDGGLVTIKDDFTYIGEHVEKHFWRQDNAANWVVTDTCSFTIQQSTDRFLFYLEDDEGTGSSFRAGTFLMNHGQDANDTYFKLEGKSTFEIQRDFVVDHQAQGGDYFEFELNKQDTLRVGGSFVVRNYGDNEDGDLIIDINDGVVAIADDLCLTLSPAVKDNQELRVHLNANSQLLVGDSLLLDFDKGLNLELYLNETSGATALLQAAVLSIDVEEEIDDTEIVLGGTQSRLITTKDFVIDVAANDGDYFSLETRGTNDSIIVGNDFTIRYNNTGSLTNIGNDLRLTHTAGIVKVNRDFLIDFVAGNDAEIQLNNGASWQIGRDLKLQKGIADEMYIYLGNLLGSGTLTVSNDLEINHEGTPNSQIEIELNQNSILDIDGDLRFLAVADQNILLDLNQQSEFRIAGAIDRSTNGGQFGSILCETTALLTYDGAAQQIMEEEAGGGDDEIQYGIVKINNSSGQMPSVVLENTLGGAADIQRLYLDQGQLDLNAQTLTVLDASADAVNRISGSILSEKTDNSSVLKWKINTASGMHLFPFSTENGAYLPFTFKLTSGNAGDVEVATYPTTSNNKPYSPTVTKMDSAVLIMDRHWQIDMSGNAIVDFSMPYLESEMDAPNMIIESNLQAQRWNGTSWDDPMGLVNTTTNTVTVYSQSDFSPWVLVNNNNLPLPIEMISFDVVNEYDHLNFSWVTVNEVNNDYFEILHSTDGIHFEPLGQVQGAGDSNHLIEYSWGYKHNHYGNHYFKLRQVDFDGKFVESDLISVSISHNQFISLYPNPTHDYLNIDVDHDNVIWELLSLEGDIIEIGATKEVNLKGYENGMYILRIDSQNFRVIKH